jgi:hypothetical protein
MKALDVTVIEVKTTEIERAMKENGPRIVVHTTDKLSLLCNDCQDKLARQNIIAIDVATNQLVVADFALKKYRGHKCCDEECGGFVYVQRDGINTAHFVHYAAAKAEICPGKNGGKTREHFEYMKQAEDVARLVEMERKRKEQADENAILMETERKRLFRFQALPEQEKIQKIQRDTVMTKNEEMEYERCKVARDKKTQDARDRHFACRAREEAEFYAINPQFTAGALKNE